MAGKTYETFGEAVNDPNSNIAKYVAKSQRVMAENDKVIAQLMASGLTREQAWAKALAAMR